MNIQYVFKNVVSTTVYDVPRKTIAYLVAPMNELFTQK